MKLKSISTAVFFPLFAIFFLPKYSTASSDTLQASSLRCYGRFAFNEKNHLELISSASHTGFSFKGRECHVFVYIPIAGEHNYLQYVLDGVYQKRIRIEGSNKSPLIISATVSGTHIVWIYKTTEAHTGPVFIEKITGRQIKPEIKNKTLAIEFIGNSITCGAAADPSETPCGTGMYHDQHNAYYAYGPRVARALHVDFMLSSVSGIGIYRNWNSEGPAMPKVYEKTDFIDKSERLWDFRKFSPDIVSIALGTNDFSNGDGKKERLPFDSVSFVSCYIKFVQLVKSKYAAAQIVLLSSPMLNGDRMIQLQNCLTAVKQSVDSMNSTGKRVALYFFKPMKARGCSGHPNVEDHAILADELIPFFKKLL